MGYDTVKDTFRNLYDKYEDYTRYRTMELVAEELKRNLESSIFQECCMAEAGVYTGDFAWILNHLFPDSKLYLYDTFEGFNNEEVKYELENSYTDSTYMKQVFDEYSCSGIHADSKIRMVKNKMKAVERCCFRKGLFPESAAEEGNNKWFLVSLDMDLYKPILEGIRFFYPNMVRGGYMFIHDYNNKGFSGIKQALAESEEVFGFIPRVPLSDNGGTVVIQKI